MRQNAFSYKKRFFWTMFPVSNHFLLSLNLVRHRHNFLSRCDCRNPSGTGDLVSTAHQENYCPSTILLVWQTSSPATLTAPCTSCLQHFTSTCGPALRQKSLATAARLILSTQLKTAKSPQGESKHLTGMQEASTITKMSKIVITYEDVRNLLLSHKILNYIYIKLNNWKQLLITTSFWIKYLALIKYFPR